MIICILLIEEKDEEEELMYLKDSKFKKFQQLYEEVSDIKESNFNCPCCGQKITLVEVEDEKFLIESYNLDEQWKILPKGWTKESLDKFAKSLTGKSKGDPKRFVRICMTKMEGKMTDPAKFCASLKDKFLGTTKWRGPSEDIDIIESDNKK